MRSRSAHPATSRRRVTLPHMGPVGSSSIPEALHRAAEGGGGLSFALPDGMEPITPVDLASCAEAGAARLTSWGIRRGDAVAVLGQNRPEWAAWAFAVWAAGAVLVPLPAPALALQSERLAAGLRSLIHASGCRLVLAQPEFLRLAGELGRPWDRPHRGSFELAAPLDRRDPAVIQFTSGSTASPKGALLTHGAVLAAVHSIAVAYQLNPSMDRFLGWLPFFHDNGLFGFLVRPVLTGCPGYVLPTEQFARDPLDWFRLIARTRATITAAPPSAWALAGPSSRRVTAPKWEARRLRHVDGRSQGSGYGSSGTARHFPSDTSERSRFGGLRSWIAT